MSCLSHLGSVDMGRGPYWPDTRTPRLIPPTLDATGGRSYSQSSQTPGALGGRRGRLTWFIPGLTSTKARVGPRFRVTGGAWRPIRATARLTVAPTYSEPYATLYYTLPGGARTYLFEGPVISIIIPMGVTEGNERPIIPGLVLPIGSILDLGTGWGGGDAEDLTVELDYIVHPVRQ